MSNEHHQTGRRPNKADLERVDPVHREKEPLKQGSAEERHSHPNEKHREHSHSGEKFVEEVKRLDASE